MHDEIPWGVLKQLQDPIKIYYSVLSWNSAIKYKHSSYYFKLHAVQHDVFWIYNGVR